LCVAFYFADDHPAELPNIVNVYHDVLAGLGARGTTVLIVLPAELASRKRVDLQTVCGMVASCKYDRTAIALYGKNPASRKAGPNEFLWEIDVQTDPVGDGVHFEAFARLTVGLEYCTPDQINWLPGAIERLSKEIVQRWDICHGLVDVGTTGEIGRGRLYGSISPGYAQFRQQLARLVWLRSGPLRKEALRGVFCGQVLPKRLVDRIGPIDTFIAEYAKLDDLVNHDLCVKLPNGGLHIWVTRGIDRFLCPGIRLTPWEFERAAFLYKRFRDAGIL